MKFGSSPAGGGTALLGPFFIRGDKKWKVAVEEVDNHSKTSRESTSIVKSSGNRAKIILGGRVVIRGEGARG